MSTFGSTPGACRQGLEVKPRLGLADKVWRQSHVWGLQTRSGGKATSGAFEQDLEAEPSLL